MDDHNARVQAACVAEHRRNDWFVARAFSAPEDCDRFAVPSLPTRSTCPSAAQIRSKRAERTAPAIDRTDARFVVQADPCFWPQQPVTDRNARTFMNWTR